MTATSHPKGSSFGNAINYIYEGRLDEHKDKKEELILHSDNIIVPRDAEDLKGRNMLKADFISQAEQHKYYGNDASNKRKYVGHHSLNFSASDMQKLKPRQIQQITADYIKDAGLENTQYIAVAHRDTENYHVHIIFNRATNERILYNDWREYNKTAERAIALNLKYGLENVEKQVEMSNSPEVLAIRSGHEDIKELKVDELISRAKNLHHLSKICEAEKRSFKEHGDIIKIEDKEYRKTDLQVVFYDNRGEDRANARQRHIEENNKRKKDKKNKSKNHEIKKNKIGVRKAEPELTEDELAEQQLKQAIANLDKRAELKSNLRGAIESILKEAKTEKQFIQELDNQGIKVLESKQDARMYVFENQDAKMEISKFQIKQQITINTTPPSPLEPSRTAEPALIQTLENTSLGVGEMAGQKASGGVKKLDGEDDEEVQKEIIKKKRKGMKVG